MAETNRFGLNRYIPANIRREVRQRSRFGCVVCRRGFYQYEHIDPLFELARTHDAEGICCLCGACHDAVTRGQLSKAMVKIAYENVQTRRVEDVGHPVGPLDFHDGSAELLIGGLLYNPAVQTMLRYHGCDLIKVVPGQGGQPGKISATFTDDEGREILKLLENEWIGALENWDIDVVGQRITVRRKHGEISLQLRLDPPGRVVVERLDMRMGDGHVLATEQTYAVGRHTLDGLTSWAHVGVRINRSMQSGAAIEFTDPMSLELRDNFLRDTGKELATQSRELIVSSSAGVMIKPLGIVVASLCGGFDFFGMALGSQSLGDMRRVILSHPEELPRFIATGKVV